MKIFRAITAVAFLAVISAGSVFAQPRTTTPAGPAPTQTGSLPETKIALVNTEEFADEKTGITRLVTMAKRVDGEFQPRRAELQTLQAQIEKATADLTKAQPLQDARVSQQQADKIEAMKTEFKRKGEDAQAAYQKRLQDALVPIYDDIGKALEAYAKTHGITLILDMSKIQGIVSASESLDITRPFITEFNSKNPATASLTPKE
ncbi:MAG: outer membrane protein [Blastocatellia bacterium]|jgi:Skp family chaperone for outer membrane proteins|nr:outer membrane protein [Blastocatellia bacterium]